DQGLVDQRLIVAPIRIHAEPEGRHGDQWRRIERFNRTDHISGNVRVVLVLELLCPLVHRHGLALAIVVNRAPVPVRIPLHGSAAYPAQGEPSRVLGHEPEVRSRIVSSISHHTPKSSKCTSTRRKSALGRPVTVFDPGGWTPCPGCWPVKAVDLESFS